MPAVEPGQFSGPEAFAGKFSVSRETLAHLELYADLLRFWQKTINLVAPSTIDHIWHRHFADSAQLLALAPAEARVWLDFGSGAGFPGLVLGLMLADRPGARVTLVESDQRKASFLREVARKTAAPVDILAARIESAATQLKLSRREVVTARAVAPLRQLLALSVDLMQPECVGLFLKGRTGAIEVTEAAADWLFDHRLVPSLTEQGAHVVVLRHVKRRN